MERISLNGAYRLYSCRPTTAPTHPDELSGDWMEATVPGNVELDYQRAGKLPDPFIADNARQAAELERLDFWYVRDFTLQEVPAGEIWLHFEGVDTIAAYFLNGVEVGRSKNMLIEHEFPVTGLLQPGENTLAVHIFSALEGAKHFEIRPYNVAFPGCYENLHIRKSAMNYGWDISPRLLSAGIWKDVWLETRDAARFENVYLATASVYDDIAVLVLSCNVKIPDAYLGRCRLTIEGTCGDHSFCEEYPLPHVSTTVYPYVNDAKLWYPQGMGEQNLYDIRLSIVCDGAVIAEKKMRFGIRKVELHFGEAVGKSGEFAVHVNGKRCRCRGVNWVPLSLLHSQDRERYQDAVRAIKDANCNMVRVWGGGVYEQDVFYDLCDEYGILVWQDVMLACHAYPMTDEFCAAMRQECEAVAKRLRNHPSLALWCGGNETDWPYVCVGLDPNDDRISRGVLKETLWQFDPYRGFLPSTPYFSREFIKKHGGLFYLDLDEIKRERTELPQEHYWWHREDFLLFREQHHRFITEIGYSGASDRESMDRYLPKGWRFTDDAMWQDHSYPTEGSRACGIDYLFTGVPDSDDDRIKASQYYQAEAYKFIVEISRMRPNCNGLLLWTLRESWPSFSSALVDYYDRRKPAFYAVRVANEPVQCMIDVHDGIAACYLINDRPDGGRFRVKITDERGKVLYEGSVETMPDTPVTELVTLPLGNEKLLLTELADGNRMVRNYRYIYTEKIEYPVYDGLYKKDIRAIWRGSKIAKYKKEG